MSTDVYDAHRGEHLDDLVVMPEILPSSATSWRLETGVDIFRRTYHEELLSTRRECQRVRVESLICACGVFGERVRQSRNELIDPSCLYTIVSSGAPWLSRSDQPRGSCRISMSDPASASDLSEIRHIVKAEPNRRTLPCPTS